MATVTLKLLGIFLDSYLLLGKMEFKLLFHDPLAKLLGCGFTYFWNFHPDDWGFMIQFDWRIFFSYEFSMEQS